jgi:hypothetical protein
MKRLQKFLDHPFMHLMKCFGLSIAAVHLWTKKLEPFEYILLAIIFAVFAVSSFLDAVLASLRRWSSVKSDD